jgi:ketosteroid isomerase-like protein
MPLPRLARLAAPALALLAACHPAARPASGPGTPAELRQQWQDAFNRADTTAIVALYAPDAVLVPPSGTVLTGGQVAARGAVGELMKDRTLRLSTLGQRTTAHAGHVQGTWTATRRGQARGPLLASGTYFMVFEQRPGGGVQIVYHVWRDDREAAIRREDADEHP